MSPGNYVLMYANPTTWFGHDLRKAEKGEAGRERAVSWLRVGT